MDRQERYRRLIQGTYQREPLEASMTVPEIIVATVASSVAVKAAWPTEPMPIFVSVYRAGVMPATFVAYDRTDAMIAAVTAITGYAPDYVSLAYEAHFKLAKSRSEVEDLAAGDLGKMRAEGDMSVRDAIVLLLVSRSGLSFGRCMPFSVGDKGELVMGDEIIETSDVLRGNRSAQMLRKAFQHDRLGPPTPVRDRRTTEVILGLTDIDTWVTAPEWEPEERS